METNPKVEQFVSECREKGLSVTSQRLAIYHDVCATDSHPTAEEVYERVHLEHPTISLATVYKTLETFEKYGFISKMYATGHKARFDANRDLHHHLICTQCGCIEDVYDQSLESLSLPRKVLNEFKVQEYRINFRGLCQNCQTSNN